MMECVNLLFENQVTETPDNISIIDKKKKITYKKLNEKINQFTHYLLRIGVKKNDRICKEW